MAPRTRSQTVAARSAGTASPAGAQVPRPTDDGPRFPVETVPQATASGRPTGAGNEDLESGEPISPGRDELVSAEGSPSATARVRTIPGAFGSPGDAVMPQSNGGSASESGALIEGHDGLSHDRPAGRNPRRPRSVSLGAPTVRVMDQYGRPMYIQSSVSDEDSASTTRDAARSSQYNEPEAHGSDLYDNEQSVSSGEDNDEPRSGLVDAYNPESREVSSEIEYMDDYVRFETIKPSIIERRRDPSLESRVPRQQEEASSSDDELDGAAQAAAIESMAAGRRRAHRSHSMSGLEDPDSEDYKRTQRELREEVAELRAQLEIFQSQDELFAAWKREMLDRARAATTAPHPSTPITAPPNDAQPALRHPRVTIASGAHDRHAGRDLASASRAPISRIGANPNVSASSGLRMPPPVLPRLSTANLGSAHYQPRATMRESSLPLPEVSRAEAFRPLNQVKPHSFLGILQNDDLRRLVQAVGDGPSDSESDSSDSSSSSSSSSAASLGRRARRKERKRRGKRRKSQRPLLRPVPPEPYDGEPDQHKLHKFIVTAATYLSDGRVPPEQQVSRLMYFLKGRAQEFYTREVANNPSEWTLLQFFQQLFNYCFPHDFLHKQRKRFDSARQGPRSVKDFLYELNELASTIGDVDERRLTLRFWDGLRRDLQSQLWLAMLNPEFSSMDEVSSAAEAAERALEAAARPNPNNGAGSSSHHAERNSNTGRQNGSSSFSRRDNRALRANRLNSQEQRPPPPSRTSPPTRAPAEQRPRISEQEKEDLKKRGLCFVCKQSGHMSRNCPEANRLRRPNNRQPKSSGSRPAVSSFAMTVTNAARLEELASATESLDCVRLASLRFVDEDEANELMTQGAPFCLTPPAIHRARADQRMSAFGDPIAYRINSVLMQARFSLGYDDDEAATIADFTSYSTEHRMYVIVDPIHGVWVATPLDLLLRTRFDLARWYQSRVKPRCASCNGLSHPSMEGEDCACMCATGNDWANNLGSIMDRFWPPAEYESDYGPYADRWYAEHLNDEYELIQDPDWGVIYIPLDQHHLWFDWPVDRLTRTASTKAQARVLAECRARNLQRWEKLQCRLRNGDFLLIQRLGDDSILILPSSEEGWDVAEEVQALWEIRFETRLELRLFALKRHQVPAGQLPALQRNNARPRDAERRVPQPIVIITRIMGHPVRALLDSGSLGDFMSSALADQLKVPRIALDKPIMVQLAVQGSRTKINYGTKVRFEYGVIDSERYFDIANVDGYDLILGTPFLYQHKVLIGFNDASVVIGSTEPMPIRGTQVTVLASRAMEAYSESLEQIREELRAYAAPLCKKAAETTLPPLRKINHRIPIVDPNRVYSFRPSKCPEAFRPLWSIKRDQYISSGRWRYTTGTNAAPLMFIKKHTPPGAPLKMRNVIDLRERNANTKKMASPLPDQRAVLYRVASKRFVSAMDGQDAYEQFRIEPEDVKYTLMNTPDGTIESLVMQQGDCNAVATFMNVMTDLFSPYLGVWMDVYLDDIIIYTDTLEEHILRVKQVIDILRREQFYLAIDKLHFLPEKLRVLGHIITRDGIRMDPEKVDNVVAWKTPTNRDLLRGFIGSVGYLADNVEGVRIPMDVLNRLTGDTVAFRWGPTEERAFQQVKDLVEKHRNSHRVSMKYGPGAPPVHLVTDGCISGIAGKISQGDDWKDAPIIAFFSAKLSPAQQNYAVHEIEMLAGLETMVRHRDLLLGVRFTWYTDHRALEHLLKQRNLTGRQARWISKMSEFDFEVKYVPGKENTVSDALSRMYSADALGTVRAAVEYAQHDEECPPPRLAGISAPVSAGSEAMARLHAAKLVVEGANPPRRSARIAQGNSKPASPPTKKSAHRTVDPPALPVVTVPAPPPPTQPARPERRARHVVEPAETGRAETAREFSKRIKKVTLHVGARPEGGIDASKLASTKNQLVDKPEGEPEGVREEGDNEDRAAGPDSSPNLLSTLPTNGIPLAALLPPLYAQDKFFALVLDKPSAYKNFVLDNALIFLIENDQRRLCIPEGLIGNRTAREIIISHAHSILAHLGVSKTLTYLREHVWWKSIVSDTKSFIDSCVTCRTSKPSNQKPYGLLNPLSVPSSPWEAIGIDFVGPLPVSKNRDAEFDMLVVIIDLLTAAVQLVPGRADYRARDMAELIFAEVYKRHGLPARIVSDRDVLFTSAFWDRLHKLIGVELRMSSAYHPETDGATERANRTVTTMLRQCVGPNQSDWVSRLPGIEFAINSARSESTGFAPFFLNSGRMPRSLLWNDEAGNEYPGVRVFAQRMKQAIMAAHDAILAARVKQTRAANRARQPSPFSVDDLVYVSTKNLTAPKGLARKLVPKYVGPFKVINDFKNNSYRIELPGPLRARGVHDVFHSSLLRVHVPNDDRLFPNRSAESVFDLGPNSHEWAVDQIVAHTGQGSTATFEVRWKAGDTTWVQSHQLVGMPALHAYLEANGVSRVEDLPQGKGQPPDDPQIFAGCITMCALRPVLEIKGEGFQPTHLHPRIIRQPTTMITAPSFAVRLLPVEAPTEHLPIYINRRVQWETPVDQEAHGFRVLSVFNNQGQRVFNLTEPEVLWVIDLEAHLHAGRTVAFPIPEFFVDLLATLVDEDRQGYPVSIAVPLLDDKRIVTAVDIIGSGPTKPLWTTLYKFNQKEYHCRRREQTGLTLPLKGRNARGAKKNQPKPRTQQAKQSFAVHVKRDLFRRVRAHVDDSYHLASRAALSVLALDASNQMFEGISSAPRYDAREESCAPPWSPPSSPRSHPYAGATPRGHAQHMRLDNRPPKGKRGSGNGKAAGDQTTRGSVPPVPVAVTPRSSAFSFGATPSTGTNALSMSWGLTPNISFGSSPLPDASNASPILSPSEFDTTALAKFQELTLSMGLGTGGLLRGTGVTQGRASDGPTEFGAESTAEFGAERTTNETVVNEVPVAVFGTTATDEDDSMQEPAARVDQETSASAVKLVHEVEVAA
jgi:hypothetical protein